MMAQRLVAEASRFDYRTDPGSHVPNQAQDQRYVYRQPKEAKASPCEDAHAWHTGAHMFRYGRA
jgi:hypothetical protein